jgi:hypothetical protein
MGKNSVGNGRKAGCLDESPINGEKDEGIKSKHYGCVLETDRY